MPRRKIVVEARVKYSRAFLQSVGARPKDWASTARGTVKLIQNGIACVHWDGPKKYKHWTHTRNLELAIGE